MKLTATPSLRSADMIFNLFICVFSEASGQATTKGYHVLEQNPEGKDAVTSESDDSDDDNTSEAADSDSECGMYKD